MQTNNYLYLACQNIRVLRTCRRPYIFLSIYLSSLTAKQKGCCELYSQPTRYHQASSMNCLSQQSRIYTVVDSIKLSCNLQICCQYGNNCSTWFRKTSIVIGFHSSFFRSSFTSKFKSCNRRVITASERNSAKNIAKGRYRKSCKLDRLE